MANRSRFAVIVTPLLALLAALLAGWSLAAAQDVSGDAGAGPLTLESAGLTTLTVTWDAVPGATRYDVRWRPPDGIFGPDQATTTTRYEITGLSPGSPYVVRVHAIGANGATLKQYRGDFRTILTAPASLTLSASTTTSLSVAWTPPAGWTPAGYRLSWRPDVGAQFQGSVQLAADVRTRAITGLTHGTRYVVRLVALNAAGTESPATHITADAREAGPTGARPLTLESAALTTLTVTWDAVPDAVRYDVRWRPPDGSFGPDQAATGTRHTITGLSPGRPYVVRVHAIAAGGATLRQFRGDFRTILTAPATLTVSAASATSLTVHWSKPTDWAPAGYLLSWRPVGPTAWQGSAQLAAGIVTHEITGLTDGTKYLIRLTALNPAGTESPPTRVTATAADAAAPLTVTLTSSRDVCTANTLTELTWTITGGKAPYRLSIDGEQVDRAAESHRINCGPIPETPAPDPAWEHLIEYRHARGFTATVTDARGVSATGTDLAELKEPLPAPANFRVGVHPGFVLSYWDQVRGARSQYPELDESQVTPAEWDTRGSRGYLVRYRTDAASTWTYAEASDAEWTTLAGYLSAWETPPPGTFYTAAIAAARHPLELETPEALNWGAPIRYTTSGPAQNLTVRATHNSVTVSWSKQPGTEQAYAELDDLRGGGGERYVAEGDEPGTHTVTFNHLEPNSDHTIWIYQLSGDGRGAVSRSFRTEAAPPGWQPLPRGPQNLRATATHDTITVTWDPPFEGASPRWSAAMLDGEIMVHVFDTYDGDTTWISSGEVDSIGRYRILPDTTYTIILTHVGIRRATQTITVTTQAAPPAGDARGSADNPPVYRHPRLPFSAAWPLRMELRHYMVADPWLWRKSRYHVGLDTGGFGGIRLAEDARKLHAVAGGVLRVFNDNPEATSYVLYCPGLPGPLHQQIVLSGAQRMTDPTTGEVTCNYLVSPASGRTALVFHDEQHVSKYAHMARGSSAQRGTFYAGLDKDAGGFIDPEDSVPVSRGAIVGLVGGSGKPDSVYEAECTVTGYDTAYCPHLHFELLRLDGTVDGDWFKRRGAFECTGKEIVSGKYGYCGWSASRRMLPLLDPERYLTPLPASPIPRDPGYGTDIQRATEGRRLFEVTGVSVADQGGIPRMDVDLSIAFWRPAFYSRYSNKEMERLRWHGIRGTRPGVDAYYTHTACADPRVHQAPGPTDGDPDRAGELPRQSRTVRLITGSSSFTCLFLVGTANPSYVSPLIPPSSTQFPVTYRVSRDDIALADPEAVLYFVEVLEEGAEESGGTLSTIEFQFYRFHATEGLTYEFCAEKDPQGNCEDERAGAGVAFELWQGSTKVEASLESNLRWEATGSGTYFLVVRGDYADGETAPYTGRYTLHYNIPLPPPTEVEATWGSNSATLFWQAVARVLGYQVRLDDGDPISTTGASGGGASGASADVDPPPLSYPFEDLTPKTDYTLSVRATGPNGAVSNWVSVSETTFPSPPVITSLALDSDGHPSVSFTWGEPLPSSYFLVWELHRADSEDGTYTLHKPTKDLSMSPVSLGERPVGWYKVRGQVCIRDGTEPLGGASGATENPLLTCGEWTAFSSAVAVKPTLSALSLSGVTLSPTFASGTLAYTASVSHSVSRTTVAATATDDTATVAFDPETDADPNAAGHQVNLASGATTTITVTVTAANDGPSSSYTVAVSRASAPVGCGTRPTKPDTTDVEDLDPTYVWDVGEDKATKKITTGTRTRTRDVTWLGYPSCRWHKGDWGKWVEDTTTTDGEVKARPADMTDEEETANDNTEWRAEATTACEWQQYDVQPIRKRATWSSANEAWEFPEDWEDDPDRSATTRWTKTTNCKAKPDDLKGTHETATDNTEWRAGTTTACEWQQYDVQPIRNMAVWSSTNEAWEFLATGWVTDPDGVATTTWKRTATACKDKPIPLPSPITVSTPVGDPETRWVTDPDNPFCILWEEQRQLYQRTVFARSWVWSSSAEDWVAARSHTLFGPANTYSEWTRTGNTRPGCPARGAEDGPQGEAETATLAAGDYTLPWGLQRISFTVAAGASVELSLRALESGVQAVVLTSAAGAELVLYPGALADGAKPSPSAADATLSAIAGTLALSTVERVAPPTAPADETCAVVTAAASGATAVDMDASFCAAVPTGALSVTLGGHTLSLTLPTGYDWLLLRVSPDPAVVGIIDMGSGTYLALDAATGAEQSREVGEDVAATLGPIFDAIVTSATPPPAEDDGS